MERTIVTCDRCEAVLQDSTQRRFSSPKGKRDPFARIEFAPEPSNLRRDHIDRVVCVACLSSGLADWLASEAYALEVEQNREAVAEGDPKLFVRITDRRGATMKECNVELYADGTVECRGDYNGIDVDFSRFMDRALHAHIAERNGPPDPIRTGAAVFCEHCGWHGVDHDLVGPGCGCPACGRMFSVTEAEPEKQQVVKLGAIFGDSARCADCGWEGVESDLVGRIPSCPTCSSTNVGKHPEAAS